MDLRSDRNALKIKPQKTEIDRERKQGNGMDLNQCLLYYFWLLSLRGERDEKPLIN